MSKQAALPPMPAPPTGKVIQMASKKNPTEADKKLMAQKMVHQRKGSHDKLPKD